METRPGDEARAGSRRADRQEAEGRLERGGPGPARRLSSTKRAKSKPAPAATRSGFRAAAPAKINLYLHVVGRRPDDYHLLDSLVAFADVHDTVTAVEAEGLTLAVSGPFGAQLANQPGNLVLRAAQALAAAGGVRPRARMRLIKRLPVASGIGGGSSDAAAALRVLSALWKLRPATEDLYKIALGLGADVPVCLGGRAMFMGGIGEALSAAPALPAAGVLLVNPGAPLATPPVFKARQGPFSKAARFSEAARDAAALCDLLGARRNDLTEAAAGLLPGVGQVLKAIDAAAGCLLARMSGSGATCFGLFADADAAAAAGAKIAKEHADWWVVPGRLIDDIGRVKPEV